MTKSIFLQRLSATIQFILGFTFGITLIAGAAAGAGYIYYKKMSVIPQKPVFFEETNVAAQKATTPVEESSDATIKTESTITPASAPEPESAPELPPNSYEARVTWPQGLSLRSEPSTNAARIGGIAYDAKILILEDTPDNSWQRVRIPWSDQEGWVKGGNTERASY